MEAVLEIQNLCREYEQFTLADVNLAIVDGSVMGLMGMNGAGKSTILKAVMGLVRPDRGAVRVMGHDIDMGPASYKQEIGYVSEEPFFYDQQSVEWTGQLAAGIFRRWDQQRFEALCALFELPPSRKTADLSRGMKAKLGLALALSHHARLLVLDEPTSGTDPLTRRQILDLLRQFMQAPRRAILFSSHITQDVEAIADQVTVLHRGRVLASEPLECFRARMPGASVEDVVVHLVAGEHRP